VAASFAVSYTYNPTAQQITFTVDSFTSPADSAAVFYLKDASPTPEYMGICTVAELSTVPTDPPIPGDYYRAASTTFSVASENMNSAVYNVRQGLDKLCVGLDAEAQGLVAGSFTAGG